MRAPLTLVLLLALSCGKSDEQKAAEAAARQLQELGKQMGADGAAAAADAATALAAGKASDAVDFRDLKALMPEDLPGMKRSSLEGQKSGAMGFTMSTAEARYETEDGASIRLAISDMGAVTGMSAMAAYAWASTEIDREDATGYEKTMTFKGYRGHEKYDRESKSGEISLLVAGRFIVEANGYSVTADALKEALEKVDLGRLEGMKNVGVK